MDVVELLPCSTVISQVTSFFASGAMANVLTAASDTGALGGTARRWHALWRPRAGRAAAAPGFPPVTAADSPPLPPGSAPTAGSPESICNAALFCLPRRAVSLLKHAGVHLLHQHAARHLQRRRPHATGAVLLPSRAFSGACRKLSCPVVGCILSTLTNAEWCLALCATLLQGNTTACRQLHVTAARLLPLIHCQHVGPDSMKCLQDECR